mmetsp:Transcript_40978/g.123627  ORF Transcript_40978/g.123627 Transcript_40978/m.123627 type:complete len:403 (+) Transcript_40978:376-1584(+)
MKVGNVGVQGRLMFHYIMHLNVLSSDTQASLCFVFPQHDLCELFLDEGVEGINCPLLRIILDDGAIRLDHIDGGEALSVELALNEIPHFVTSELVDVNVGLLGEGGVLILHALAELTPRRVNGNDRGLAGLDNLEGGITGLNVFNGSLLPEIAIEGLLGSGNVNPALGLGRAVLVLKSDESSLTLRGVIEPRDGISLELEIDEAGGTILGNGDGILRVSDGGVALGVERMMRDIVLRNVIEGVLEGPVGQGVALGQPSADGSVLELVDPRPFESLPSGASVDHAVGVESLESALERLDLAHLVVLLNVLLPQIGAVLSVVGVFVEYGDSLGAENLGLESVVLLDLLDEIDSFGEEVEGINAHDRAFAVLEITEAIEKVRNDHVAGDEGVGEDGVVEVFARGF